MKKDFSYGVIPVIKENEESLYLLIHHKGGDYWGFPKGHKEEDETDIETAKRELKEETGITAVEIFPEPSFIDSYIFTLNEETYDKTATFYIGIVKSVSDLTLQPTEVDDAKWLNLLEAKKLIKFKNLIKILEQANDFVISRES